MCAGPPLRAPLGRSTNPFSLSLAGPSFPHSSLFAPTTFVRVQNRLSPSPASSGLLGSVSAVGIRVRCRSFPPLSPPSCMWQGKEVLTDRHSLASQPCPRPWDGAEGFYLYLHGAEVEEGGGRGFPSARELPPLAPLFLFLSFKSSVEALGMRSHSQLKLRGREKETSPIHSPS